MEELPQARGPSVEGPGRSRVDTAEGGRSHVAKEGRAERDVQGEWQLMGGCHPSAQEEFSKALPGDWYQLL